MRVAPRPEYFVCRTEAVQRQLAEHFQEWLNDKPDRNPNNQDADDRPSARRRLPVAVQGQLESPGMSDDNYRGRIASETHFTSSGKTRLRLLFFVGPLWSFDELDQMDRW
jgi:hypothetical protein